MKVVIVGGGVAGPALALGLHRAGIASVLLERRAQPDPEAGSYLTVGPNGLDALEAVGALAAVRKVGFDSRLNALYGATGRLLGRISLGPSLDDGTVGLTMKRSRLASALEEEADRRGVDVRRGQQVVSVATTPGSAYAEMADGSRVEGDLVVGADGVHSLVRRVVDPTAPLGRYVGLANFGGITRGTAVARDLEPQAWHMVFGRRAFFGAHPTPDGDVVWFVNEPRPRITRAERAATAPEAWRQHLVQLVSDDAGPAAELVAGGVLELAGDSTYDLPHVPAWSRGRLVVLGDAAHAPSPSSGQGASLALEDGVVLAQALRDSRDVASALAAYEGARRRRVERVVAAGARSSSSKVPGRLARPVQEQVLRLVFRHLVTDRAIGWMGGQRLDWEQRVDA